MPASSVSGLNSWGVYLFASVALVLVLTPQLAGAAQASRRTSDWRNLDGIRALVDSLRPGEAALFSYGIPGASDAVRLGGREAWCVDGAVTIAEPTLWPLPNFTLAPGTLYRLGVSRGEVTVEQVV